MTRRTQAVLCFATAFVAIFLYRSAFVTKYVVGAVAASIGVSLWQDDKRQRTAEAARRARVAAVAADEDEDTPA